MDTHETTSTLLRVRIFASLDRRSTECVTVRTTRARIIRLRNDYKDIMSKIEAGLHSHHAQARNLAVMQSASASSNQSTSTTNQSASDTSTLEAPFAKVNSVVAGSPADSAGLKVGDMICRFGDVDWINHEKLSKVAETVQRNEGVSSWYEFFKGNTLTT